jgi:competence transcription factor ComK
VALIRTDVSEDRIASIFRVHECEQVTERSCKLLYRQRLVGYSVETSNLTMKFRFLIGN